MHKLKMPNTARNRYCASYVLQWCVRRARIVSEGLKDVSRDAIEDVGELREEIFDRVARNRLRIRCGM